MCSGVFKCVQIWGRGGLGVGGGGVSPQSGEVLASLEGLTLVRSILTPSHHPSVHRAGPLTQVPGTTDGFGCESRGHTPTPGGVTAPLPCSWLGSGSRGFKGRAEQDGGAGWGGLCAGTRREGNALRETAESC